MSLTPKQKRYLRSLSHQLKPIVQVGQGGLSEAVLREIAVCLQTHELIKVRIGASDRTQRRAAVATIHDRAGAEPVQSVGHVATFYRANPDEPRIRLPAS